MEDNWQDKQDAQCVQQMSAWHNGSHGRTTWQMKNFYQVPALEAYRTLRQTGKIHRRRFIEHVLRLPTSRPASLVIDWTPEGKVEDGAGQSRHGRIHVEKILRRWFSDFCYRSKHIHIIDRHLRWCLTKLQEWADTNGFKFSTAKTVCVHFCRLHKFYSDPQLLVNGSPIPVVEEVKSLGIIFDKNSHFFLTCITWKINVQKLLTCYVLSHTPLGVQINKLLLHLYRSLIRSRLECGPMPNLMVALQNIGGALCSTP